MYNTECNISDLRLPQFSVPIAILLPFVYFGTSVKLETEFTIHKWNIPVLLQATFIMCSKIKFYGTFFNNLVDSGTSWFQ